MAMNLPSASGSNTPEPLIEINTTPLIDVMLVLLVMLIITIPVQLDAINLNLPVGNPPPASDVKPEVVRIDLDERGTVFWNGEAVANRADLQARLQAVAAQASQPEIHIRPNKTASYNTFAEVMVDVNQAGLTKLGVVGSEQFIDH